MKYIGITGILLLILLPTFAGAQDSVEREYLEKARVLDATPSSVKHIDGTTVNMMTQTITVQVLEGVDAGTTTSFENDYTQVKKGDLIYVRHTVGGFGPELWSVSDPYRLHILYGLGALFLVLIVIFGGIQGIRGLASLAGSLVLIFSVLLPGIYQGQSPILLSIGVAGIIIVVGSYITHGFRHSTSAAVLGMIITVCITGLLGYLVVAASHLSGFTSETNVYLNFNTAGTIDMAGLLFGGIMIGLLGVLYDIAIGQAVAVEELFDAGKHLTRLQVYKKGLRIGREHIGALINTLAIAYVGAALPMLLLIRHGDASLSYILNSELFATEIIRVLIGSIGLILAVPITTLIASYMLHGRTRSVSSEPHHHH